MSEFVNYLSEVFEHFGPIHTRKMFGGHGVYHQGLMFGLVADDELYLKVDKDSIGEFESRDLQAFTFESKGKVGKMSYHQAPEEIYDDPDQATLWAQIAFDAAVRTDNKKPLDKRKRTL